MYLKVHDECYKEFGSDLDGCSTQESEGCGRCGRCVLAKRIPTNADHIRSMSDEELAEFLKAEMYNDFKPSCKESTFFSADAKPECNKSCVGCVLDWLRQPAEG